MKWSTSFKTEKMKLTNSVLLIIGFLLFSSYVISPQGKFEKALEKADTLLSETNQKEAAFVAYKKAMKFARRDAEVEEISKGMLACAVGLFREGVQLQTDNKSKEAYSQKFAAAWKAFKEGEAKLPKEKVNSYAIYASAASAVSIGNFQDAIPYLETLKSRNYGLAKVYELLVQSYLKTDPQKAQFTLNEGLKKYPEDANLRSMTNLMVNPQGS